MKPLNGVRIISVEQFGAAPYGSMFLADLGAQVIKVENVAIGGDPARYTGPHKLGEADSQYFQTWNANKQSIALDLRSDEGRQALLRLVENADALVNNLRGDLPSKMGLDYATLCVTNPAIVCLHISAYGRDNERASWPGYDYLMQAESGLMDLTGEPGGPPSRLGAPSIIDHMTGITGAVGLLAALLGARSSGVGCDVDTCLFDVALHQLGYAAIWSLNEAHTVSRQPRSSHFSLTPVQTFPTADGWIFIMCMTEKFWQALLQGIDATEIADDPRFIDVAARNQHREELNARLDAVFRTQSSAHWLSVLQGKLPIGPVLTVDQALNSPFVVGNGMISQVPHPLRLDFRMLSNPLKIDGKRLSQRVCAALGENTEAILGEASRQEIGST
ncbi:CoA transferase [Burkholderia sp. SG-MS1]|uniref:CaiB/BaiF CoA transferase family protein n=1 Tax=Paraburkholderia sp. SG-MS1 TaxID=2023741 RepID=UPI001448653E|nr:CoA transferase [Paraburkholderia sp. SG-MS1]NKJ48544.1 CoA transferase [Paraburkholderia sp. SG-MS1]